jgi:glutamate--cysteine ligase
MLHDSPPLEALEVAQLDANHARVAVSGRDPALALDIAGQRKPLVEWGRELCRQLEPICELLDRGDPARSYSASLELQAAKLEDPSLTPSARILAEMRDEGESFFSFALRMSRQHADYFAALPPMSAERRSEFEADVEQSLGAQRALEAAPPEPFEDYLARYFAAPGA